MLVSQLNLGGHLEDGFIQIGTVKADLKSCLDAASYQISPIEKLYKRLDVSRHSRMIDRPTDEFSMRFAYALMKLKSEQGSGGRKM